MDVITIKENSIKEIKIDGMMYSRFMYKDGKWLSICLKCNIFSAPGKKLCPKHYKGYPDEIRLINGKRTKWNGKNWSTLCCIRHCKKYAYTDDKCKDHLLNPMQFYSPLQNILTIYNDVSNEINNEEVEVEGEVED